MSSRRLLFFFFFNDTATTEIYTLSLHDALPISWERAIGGAQVLEAARAAERAGFDWVSCSDHVAVPVSRAAAMGATWFDAGSTLAFVAGATTRIPPPSPLLLLPYPHPPLVAQQYR